MFLLFRTQPNEPGICFYGIPVLHDQYLHILIERVRVRYAALVSESVGMGRFYSNQKPRHGLK